jgi:hypothetical protein
LFLNKLKSFGTVVKGNKVPTTDIESVKIFDCILGIIDVVIDDKGSSFFITFGAFADLSDRTEAIEDLVELLVGDFVGKVAYKDYFVDLRGQFDDSLLL